MTHDGRTARSQMFGREFRPFAFIISLSTARVTVSLFTATVYAVLL